MKTRRQRRNKRKIKLWISMGTIVIALAAGGTVLYLNLRTEREKKASPEELIAVYMKHTEAQEYDSMYSMLAADSVSSLSKEEFVKRNANIYEGIGLRNMSIENIEEEKLVDKQVRLTYDISFETVAGEIGFENEAAFIDTEDGYKLIWDHSLILPELEEADKIRVATSPAERGNILDRNGTTLAGKGMAASVGVVPGKLDNWDASIQRLSELLEMEPDAIEKKLEANWVKEDSFVPIKTIPKVDELDMIKLEPDEESLSGNDQKEQLLSIPGVMISDVEVRSYGLKEAASHLVGYVQGVTAEDLEKHKGEGYNSNSVIGRSGMEGLYEAELRGQDGHEIRIVDAEGKTKKILASVPAENGQDIRLTIDADLQRKLYDQFKDDKSCSVAMNPYTGEVLALVSTPSYDNNDFIMGMTDAKWTSLNEDERKPMYNRFRQKWCPGSSFKPVIAGIGLNTGTVDANEDLGMDGLSWQKDESWGSYHVTTLHEYESAIMENALIYSDNIYFAKAALKIGEGNLEEALDELGFNQELPFEILMTKSQYSNSEKIETEIQLADSGYGQGQILVNPLHLASLYTAFLNNGDAIKPYLLFQEGKEAETWIPQAFPEDASNIVLDGLKKVVNDPHGTGYGAHMDDIMLAGKTGTAEIKNSKEDTSGTELGWFSVFTTDAGLQNPILITSMVEDVKDIGGSGYVVKKNKAVLDEYLKE